MPQTQNHVKLRYYWKMANQYSSLQ